MLTREFPSIFGLSQATRKKNNRKNWIFIFFNDVSCEVTTFKGKISTRRLQNNYYGANWRGHTQATLFKPGGLMKTKPQSKVAT